MASDCPICLNEMSREDTAYPTLCACGYNFCLNCIEHMIESSKSPMEMASDGNLAVKLQLQCPQCRNDLKHTLNYTVILRKAENLKKFEGVKDSDLTASELRQKHAFEEKEIIASLDEARNKYNANKNGSIATFESNASNNVELPPYIDTNLFNGLQYFMSDEEQVYVEMLMTSGDASKLAQAAQILDGVADICRQGGVQNSSIYTRPNQQPSQPRNQRPTQTRRQYTGTATRAKAVSERRALAMGRTEKENKEQARLEKIQQFNKRHPLPVRMPNYVVIPSKNFRNIAPTHRSFPLQFIDDEWDGTIADAFARVNISRNSTVTKKSFTNIKGVSNILNAGDNQEFSDNAISTISKPMNRVVISKVKGEAGKQGAQSGDVVTHLNGEKFEGDAEDLRNAIIEYGETSANGDLAFVLNAEPSVAEALKLRSAALSLAIK